jgi:hypothetical protein
MMNSRNQISTAISAAADAAGGVVASAGNAAASLKNKNKQAKAKRTPGRRVRVLP